MEFRILVVIVFVYSPYVTKSDLLNGYVVTFVLVLLLGALTTIQGVLLINNIMLV